jgi:hypothetical protein
MELSAPPVGFRSAISLVGPDLRPAKRGKLRKDVVMDAGLLLRRDGGRKSQPCP